MARYTLIYVNPITTRTTDIAEFGDDKDAAVAALNEYRAKGTPRYMVFDADDPERGYLHPDGEF